MNWAIAIFSAVDNLREKILKEGENPAEKVIFAILNTAYEGQCYQVNPMPSEIERGVYEVISVNWRPSLNVSRLLSTIKVYVTSRYNADGILQTYWLDGDNLDFTLDKYTYTEVGLKEVETVYLEEKTQCSTVEGMNKRYLADSTFKQLWLTLMTRSRNLWRCFTSIHILKSLLSL